MNVPQPFQILKMDKRGISWFRAAPSRGNRASSAEIVQQLEEGQVVEGVVKNITDYGAFVDLGGIDGLLHVTDIAWRPSITPTGAFDRRDHQGPDHPRQPESHRISLGIGSSGRPGKALRKYPIGAKFISRVTNITTTVRSWNWSRAWKA